MSRAIPLTAILPRLPAEARSWIAALSPPFRRSTEHVLNIVGEDSFIRNWKTHRDDQVNLDNDFAGTGKPETIDGVSSEK
jgi:hypothetical protein